MYNFLSKSAKVHYIECRVNLMKYDAMIRLGLPIGSGAIESSIRRVINQRLKAPGTFWLEENVDPMLYMRAQALTGRWEEMMLYANCVARVDRKRNVIIDTAPTILKPDIGLLFQKKSCVSDVAA